MCLNLLQCSLTEMSGNWFYFHHFERQWTLKYTQKHAVFTFWAVSANIPGPDVQGRTENPLISDSNFHKHTEWSLNGCAEAQKCSESSRSQKSKPSVLQEDWSLSACPWAHEDAAAGTNSDPSRRSPPHTPHYLHKHTITHTNITPPLLRHACVVHMKIVWIGVDESLISCHLTQSICKLDSCLL